MSTILTISDSVEGTPFDLYRCTTTIKDFGLEPLAVVPRISYKDGTSESNDVSEMIDYVFSECDFSAVSVGFITEPEVITHIGNTLEKHKKAPVVCCPSMISREGEIRVGVDVFSALCDKLLKHVDLLVVNLLEAEAVSGIECPVRNDYMRAARKIYNLYGCSVFIKGGQKTDEQGVLFDGHKPAWVNPVPYEEGFRDRYSFLTALSCGFAKGNSVDIAVAQAAAFVSGNMSEEVKQRKAEEAIKQMQSAEAKMRQAAIAKREEQKAAREATPESKPATMVSNTAAVARHEAPVTTKPQETETSKETKPHSSSFDTSSFTPVPHLSLSFDSKPFSSRVGSVSSVSAGNPVVNSSVTSSLVTPGKSLRDIAREITPAPKAEDTEAAITSTIEKPEPPKGEVTDISRSWLKSEHTGSSITDLQSLKDRLDNLNRLADSGK